MIDSKGLPIKPTGAPKRGVPIRAPGDTRPAPLRSISSLYEQVLSWNTDLEGDRPPNFPFELRSIPNSFQNGDREYAMTFEPLLILECWEQLQKAKEELNSEDNLITKLTSVDAFHDITITAAGKDVRLRGWSENDVLRMIQMGPPNQETNKSFLCKVNSVIYKGDEAVVQARMFVGSNTSLIPILRTNSKWRSIRTYSLTTAIREYSSICTLPSLSLRNDILQPAKTPRAQPKKTEISMMMDRYGLNQPQAAAISAALTQNAGFTLIQGPPGTGKTKTILGLISAFLSQHTIIKVPGEEKRPKSNRLLCCAPSNAAIDEIVRRLKIGISGPSGTFVPKIVRIGAGEAIHSSVRDVTLDSLLEKMLEESGTLEVEDKQDEIRRAMNALKDEREQLRAHENDADIDAAKAEEINSQIAVVSKKLAAMHEKLTKERQERSTAALARDKYKRQLKRKLLLEADVILTTLSGAGSDVLGDLPDLTFPTVIVDEAAQSVELSTIIPLRYGAKKCVLVGDPQQLPPTVLSQVGQGHRYEQSLFQRIMNNSPDVTHLLSISYRMHPQISSYVSRAFYGGKLQDAPGMSDISKAPWHSDPLYPPYQLVDMHSGREQTGRGHSYYNSDEARLCADLVETLCLRYPKYNFVGKIGVITFYKKQVREIKNALIRRGWSREVLQNLDVNTVDGFQGQEKEIIILSCVRANRQVGFISDVRRMNVAMSRAKYSLIVLGNVDTLQTHRVWRHLVDDAFDRRMVVRSSDAMFKLRNGAGPPPANLSTPTRMLESSDVSTDSSDDAPSVGTSGSKVRHDMQLAASRLR
ncbi:P-loop containing nucleoside triphosphate hydrolase protein, partial [Powellomyces hirtus]